jgi:pimeloyl-ACP methyl ester carboxylesterase
LLSRDDIADDGRLATALTALGVAVTSETPPGYIAMMQDAFDSVVPEQALIRIADYLELGASVVSSGPLKCIYERIAKLGSHGIAAHEQVLRFGPGNRLFGVATVPSAPVPGAPTILLLNTGSNHHVGPSRLYVKMARRFAAAGFRVLRFDISGIGDSPIRPGGSENNVYATQSVDDVRFAMDAEQARTGASSFALFGICSGACVAFNGAVTDPRVVAQVLVNLPVFHFPVGLKLLHSRTAGKSTLYYKSKISQFDTWGRLLRGQVNLWWIVRALSRRGWDWACHHISCIKSLLFTGHYRHSDVEHRFLDLCNRGTRSLLIFSFDDNGIDVVDQYLGAGASRMRHQANFHLEIISNVDHTFTPIWSHDLLIDKVLVFLCDKSDYSEARGSRHQSISVSSGS